jgi:hypothetical protein
VFSPKSLNELRHQPDKVRAMIESTPVDACVVISAARPVLEMFARNTVPAFAVFGRFLDLPLSGFLNHNQAKRRWPNKNSPTELNYTAVTDFQWLAFQFPIVGSKEEMISQKI